MSELTNQDRADFARHAVDEYQRNKEGHEPDEPMQTVIIDLLADLLHLADAESIDLVDCLRMSTDHYDAETRTCPDACAEGCAALVGCNS